MIPLELSKERIHSDYGTLPISGDDEITRKLSMLIAGQCGNEPIDEVVARFDYSRQRYFQLLAQFRKQGAKGLLSSKRGPKAKYRRTQEVVCQVIRHRFLDPEASTKVIAQKLRQCHFRVSKRTVDRIIAQYGLQKKTLPVPPASTADRDRDLPHLPKKSPRKSGRNQHRTRRPPTAGR